MLPLWGRRPAGAVRPQVLHQGLPPGLPGPGQAALRWVPAPSPACRSPWGPGWPAPCRARHVRLAVHVRVCACGGRPAGRRHGPESEAGGAGVRPVAPGGGLEPSPLWSAGQPQGLSPPPSPTGPGEEAGRRQASPQGDRGRGLLLLPRRVSGGPRAPVGKLTTPERNSRLKDRSANSCEGKAGLSEREITFQIDGERWRSQLTDRRRRRCPSAVAAASPRASRPVHWRGRGRSHLDVGPGLGGGRCPRPAACR